MILNLQELAGKTIESVFIKPVGPEYGENHHLYEMMSMKFTDGSEFRADACEGPEIVLVAWKED